MKKRLLALFFGSALVLSACGGGNGDNNAAGNNQPADNNNQSEQTDNGNNASGTVDTAAAEKIYQTNCSSCHGQDLSGVVGPNLQHIGQKHSKDEIVKIIHGQLSGISMPPVTSISDEDAKTVAAWLAAKK